MTWTEIAILLAPFAAFLAAVEIARCRQSHRREARHLPDVSGRLRGRRSAVTSRAPANFSDPFFWIGHGGSVRKYR